MLMDALHYDDDDALLLVVQARDQRVESHLLTLSRVASDCASAGLSGSSMMKNRPRVRSALQ